MSEPVTAGTLTAAEAVEQTARPILEFARGWMLNPKTAARGEELGLTAGRGFWICGRNGVLGEVDADVVANAVGFMHPAALRPLWEHRPAGVSSAQLADEYAQCAYRWGREALAGTPENQLRRLNTLGRAVANAALPQTGVLFAAWRAVAPPEDAAAAVTLTLHVLRELRGGAHLAAVIGSGMHPAEAALAAPPPRGGPGWAADLGWPEPFPDMALASAHRSQAEVQTSALCVAAFENGLTPAERSEFTTLVVEARAAIG